MTRYLLPILLLLSIGLCAQRDAPRVGLVLSGGGARGFAHVGVIKQLEAAGVQIDYIGGTSMGSIIGSLYAAGYTGHQLDSILREVDIFEALLSQTERRQRPFYQKQYNERYILSLSLEDFGIALPTAISGGQGVYDLLSRLTAHVHHIEDFRNLPIPFLAVATNLENGREVILERGYLPQVVRASGALPSLLSPIEIDGKLLSDGGIVNNFPVGAVRAKGVDFIIGVDVGEGYYDRTQLKSIPDILGQISTFQSVERGKQQEGMVDILIRPDLTGYGIASFTDTDSILLAGEQAALDQMEALRDLAQRQRAGKQVRRAEVNPGRDSVFLSEFRINAPKQFTENSIRANFPTQMIGWVQTADIYESIDDLYALGYFDRIEYKFIPDGRDRLVLELNPIVKPNFDRSVSIGIHYDDVNETAALINATFLNVGLQNSILSTDIIAGYKFRYLFNYFVDNGKKPSFGLQSRLHRVEFENRLAERINLTGGGSLDRLDFDLQDWTHSGNFRFLSTDDLAVGIGAGAKFFKIETSQVEFDQLPIYLNTRDWYLFTNAYALLDYRDERYFPARGLVVSGHATLYRPVEGESNAGLNLDLRANLTLPVNQRMAFGVEVEGGFNRGATQNPWQYFVGGNEQNYLNNFRPFPGLDYAEVVGGSLLKVRPYYQLNLFDAHFMVLSGNIARVSDLISETDGATRRDFRSLALTYGIRSPLGPLEVTYAFSNRRRGLYVNLGHWF